MSYHRTDSSLVVGESTSELSDSEVAAIVVCCLIAVFIIIAVVIFVILYMLRRRRQQKEAAAAAQQTMVGPATKPSQPTHNGTWSGTFRGLWKVQKWADDAEDDEMPLSERAADGNRSRLIPINHQCSLVPETAAVRR